MKKLTLLFVSLLALSVPSFAGLITVDDLNDIQFTGVTGPGFNNTTLLPVTTPVATALGGITRQLVINVATGDPTAANSTAVNGAGKGALSLGTDATGYGLWSWDPVLASIDLSDPTLAGLQLGFLKWDLPSTLEIVVNTTAGMLTYTAPMAGFNQNVPNVFVPFSAFTGTGNLAAVTDWSIRISGTETDASFGPVSLVQVPEPGTYALMGAGLLALAALRRKK